MQIKISGTYPILDAFLSPVGAVLRAPFTWQPIAIYRSVLPSVAFAMQGFARLMLYGKYITALRRGLEPSALRLANELGPLPT